MKSLNKTCLSVFAKLERYLRSYGSSFHWNRFDCRCAYWLSERFDEARELFAQRYAEEVLRPN